MTERLPTVSAREMIQILNKLGFNLKRQSGSHATYKHPDGRRTTIPIHPGDLPRPLFREILKQIKISEDEIRKFL